mgnify:CR=1 FL=1
MAASSQGTVLVVFRRRAAISPRASTGANDRVATGAPSGLSRIVCAQAQPTTWRAAKGHVACAPVGRRAARRPARGPGRSRRSRTARTLERSRTACRDASGRAASSRPILSTPATGTSDRDGCTEGRGREPGRERGPQHPARSRQPAIALDRAERAATWPGRWLFGITVVGIALLLSGIGFIVPPRSAAHYRRREVAPSHEPEDRGGRQAAHPRSTDLSLVSPGPRAAPAALDLSLKEETPQWLHTRNRAPAPVETEIRMRSPRSPRCCSAFWLPCLGFFALMMWADARESRDTTRLRRAPRAAHDRCDRSTTRALPLNSFAGVVPENAAELAAGAQALRRDAAAADGRRSRQGAHDAEGHDRSRSRPGVKYNTWAFDGHGAPGPVVHVREGQTVEMTLDERRRDPALDRLPRRPDRTERGFQRRRRRASPSPSASRRATRASSCTTAARSRCSRTSRTGCTARSSSSRAKPAAAGRPRVRARRQRVVPERRRHRRAAPRSTWRRRAR